ncbi:MAG TPA: sigma-70 family RNA polymerase sigma factor [Gemmatimonadales bacterium]|nr:sigma-70 family RNA polymerase sigma factor [Gemmatimonadales bacterium]
MPTREPEDPLTPAALPTAVPTEAALAVRFWERLRLFAARRLGDRAAAEDVAQETLRRVLEAVRGGRLEEPAALPGFVFSTARHICAQHYRAAGREARALERLDAGRSSGGHADALAALITEERRRAVHHALARLAESDREILQLVFYEQVETEQVARRLALSPGAVRVRKHRALRRLSELLTGQGGNDPPGSAT